MGFRPAFYEQLFIADICLQEYVINSKMWSWPIVFLDL